jgi:heat shock protein HtpX
MNFASYWWSDRIILWMYGAQAVAEADALEKLDRWATAWPLEANPATAHLFIVNPLRGSSILHLFSTHPPIEERVVRLRAMRIV